MKVAIFGATGKTGKLVLEKALALGWDVTALARTPGKLDEYQGKLRVVTGASDQPDAILETVRGADVVISAMGYGESTLTTFAHNIVVAMKTAGVMRIISLIGASVALPGDPHTLSMAMLRTITRLFAKNAMVDGDGHARIIRASRLDYTLVRPPRLTTGPATNRIQNGLTLNLGPTSSISRADLAEFMIEAVVKHLYVRATPMVAA